MKKWLWMMFGCLGMLSGTLLGQSGENPHGPLQWECQACHTTSSWNKMRNPMDFRHEETGFALDGRHGDIECYTCHETPDFKAAATECASCHTDVHQAQFGLDCQRCHTPDSWDNQFEVLELHAAQGFPLTGVHTSVDCQACHNSADQREFAGLDVNCYACHMGDYVMTEDPSHKTADFSLDCESCHRPAAVSWQGATYQHSEAFKLSGAHLQADCIGCHQNGYAGTSNDCYTCHQVDYNRVEFPNHAQAGFPTECASCHNEVRWEGAVFDHLQASGFELRGAHATAFCQTCHVGGQVTGLPRDCVGCHQTDFNNTSDPDHVANGFPTECAVCHSENAWEPADFDHNLTDFPLTGSHISVDCIDCHDQGYANTPDDCYSCHQVDFENADDPNHVANNFSHNCLDCHNTTDWDDSDFNHDNTDFPLTGAHIPLDCISCHDQGYVNTPTNCFSCHEADFAGTTDPNHAANNFSQNCVDCHNTGAWEPADFDHANTDFPLTGAHIPLDCISCHDQGYVNTPTNCFSCHETDFTGTTDPNHVANNFSQNCVDCHNTGAWDPANFDHANTGFPLTGAHIPLDCISCHDQGYVNTPTDCFSCHAGDFNGVTDPNHVANNFSHDCLQCHSTDAWDPANFDHANTGFPLTGAHIPLDCISCHDQGYVNTPTDCFSCHDTDFNGVTDPNHVANNFSHDCLQCHSTDAWDPANFDHANTGFPLTGAHIPLDCISCHDQGYVNTPSDCFSCHEPDFTSTTDPDHVANNFSHNCLDCHNTNTWDDADFDHSNTNFPLTGAHIPLDCISCHDQGYVNTPTDCFSCHDTDFNGVTDPNHVANNFSHDCLQCHSTDAWDPANFDHSNTNFPLTGAHIPLDCISCHDQGYVNTPSDCFSCHEPDFTSTTDPDHVANNFSHNCLDCHNTNTWDDADFDHSNTGFPLTGAHIPLDCIACHDQGYQNTPSDCFACHQDNFNNTTNPDHQAAGFPTDCEQCHSTSLWDPSTFDHDNQYFPIYSGQHRNEWNLCSDCHIANNYATFECIFCHEHNRNNEDDNHRGVRNYVYESAACYNCHPDGREGIIPKILIDERLDRVR